MLKTQEYLRRGKTLEQLAEEHGILFDICDTKPLVSLNYDMVKCQKSHPITIECRGLVLEKDTWNIVAKPFDRFFNWGDMQHWLDKFDWDNFVAQTKEDGSLILVYYYGGEWMINTRQRFGKEHRLGEGETSDEIITRMIGNKIKEFDKLCTHVFEYCSMDNKVVREYKKSKLYLLTVVGTDHDSYIEFNYKDVDGVAAMHGLERPEIHHFDFVEGEDRIGKIRRFLYELSKIDPTNEGVVICDINNNRWKMKPKAYDMLHKLAWEKNKLMPKHILPFVLEGESKFFLETFPQFEKDYKEVCDHVKAEWDQLVEVWEAHKHEINDKEFARAIKGETRFVNILFHVRKRHQDDLSIECLKRHWTSPKRYKQMQQQLVRDRFKYQKKEAKDDKAL